MKKQDAIKDLNPGIKSIVNNLKRKSLYLFKSYLYKAYGGYGIASYILQFDNSVVLLTHFYKKGIRIKILATPNNLLREERHQEQRLLMAKKYHKNFTKSIRLIPYQDIPHYNITKIEPTDLPLYIDIKTHQLEDYFKTMEA